MAEDKNNDEAIDDPLADIGSKDSAGKSGKMLQIILPAAIIVIFAAAGHFASRMTAPAQAGVEQPESGDQSDTPAADEPKKDKPATDDVDRSYFDLEPIVINPNEPQVTRFLRVTFSLAIGKDDFSDAEALIKKKTNEIQNWLITYLCDLSLEDVRGAKSINRVRREVQDLLNDKLWPDSRPMIVSISLKEWIVQ